MTLFTNLASETFESNTIISPRAGSDILYQASETIVVGVHTRLRLATRPEVSSSPKLAVFSLTFSSVSLRLIVDHSLSESESTAPRYAPQTRQI